LEVPQNRSFSWKIEGVSFVPPPYICEKRTISGKTNEIKVWCYWEHLGEYIEKLGNVSGFKNTLGTKRIEINPTHPHPPKKKP
jgi:hypothetical protein